MRKPKAKPIDEFGPIQALAGLTNSKNKNERSSPFQSIELDSINLSIKQVRTGKGLDQQSIKELAQSILAVGIIQPIIVQPFDHPVKKYQLIAGERRVRATILCREQFVSGNDFGLDGFKRIPAIIREPVAANELNQLMVIENWQREGLDPVDEAMAIASIRDSNKDLKTLDLPKALGKSKTTIMESLVIADWLQTLINETGDLNPILSSLRRTAKKILYEVAKTRDKPYHKDVLKYALKGCTKRKLQAYVEAKANPAPKGNPNEAVMHYQRETANQFVNARWRILSSSLARKEKEDLIKELEESFLSYMVDFLSPTYFQRFNITLIIEERTSPEKPPLKTESIDKIDKIDTSLTNLLKTKFKDLKARPLEQFEKLILGKVNSNLGRIKNNSISQTVLGKALNNGLTLADFVDDYNSLINRHWPRDMPGSSLFLSLAARIFNEYEPPIPGYRNERAFIFPTSIGGDIVELLPRIDLEEEENHHLFHRLRETVLKTHDFSSKVDKNTKWSKLRKVLASDPSLDAIDREFLSTSVYCGDYDKNEVILVEDSFDLDITFLVEKATYEKDNTEASILRNYRPFLFRKSELH